MAEQICSEYKSSLEDLTFNSKPLINVLTMLADDNINFAPQIVQTIEAHLRKAKVEHKLPVVYLIDSIIKNVGKEYLHLFRQNIVSNFCSVFEKGDEKVRMMLFKVRQTWSEIFTSQKLHAIDTRVNQLDPAWPVVELEVRPSIHVNPKFLPSKSEGSGSSIDQKNVQSPTNEDKQQAMIEAQMKEKLKEKQHELLRLQKHKLVLELSQTKAILKEQTRQLKQVQCQEKHTNNPQTNAANMAPVNVVANIANQSAMQVNAQSRDPRLNGKIGVNRDPRIYAKMGISNEAPKSTSLNVKADIIAKGKINPDVKSVPNVNAPTNKLKQQKYQHPSRSSPRDSSATISYNKSASRNEVPLSAAKGISNMKQQKSNSTKEHSSKNKKSTQLEKAAVKMQKSSDQKAKLKSASKIKKAQVDNVFSPKKSRSHSPVKKNESSPNRRTDLAKADKSYDIDLRSSPKGTFKRAAPKELIENPEPPVKKLKESVLDELFGGQDRDYRPQLSKTDNQLADTPTNKKEWTKYKVSHPDEYQSPRRPHPGMDQQYGFGKEDTDLRYNSENEGKDRQRSRDRLQSTVQMTVMVKNRDAILKQAEQRLRLGQINEQLHGELLENLGKVLHIQDERKRQFRNKTKNKSRMKRIKIDSKMREIKFENGRCIVVMDNHMDHLIRFKGKGRNVIINNQELFLDFNGEEKIININGNQHSLKFGGPTRELLVDNIPYEGRFGGQPIWVKIDGEVYRAQLQGPAPEVDVLALKNRDVNDESHGNFSHENLNDGYDEVDRQDNNHSLFDDFSQSRRTRNRNGNWKSGSPPMNRNRGNMSQNAFLSNNDQLPSREWPADLNESRSDKQRWKRNMHSFKDSMHSEKLEYNSSRGGPVNRFSDHRNNSLLPHPSQEMEHLKLERDSSHRRRNSRFSEPRQGPGRSRPYPPFNRMPLDNRKKELNQPDLATHGPGSHFEEIIPRMPVPSLIPENEIPRNDQVNPILPPPPFFNTSMVINPVQAKLPNNPPIEAAPAPPSIMNSLGANLDITSLFDKLVTTGIISKSDTGAGYNVGSENIKPEPKTDEVPTEIEKKPEVKPPEIELTSASLKQSHGEVLEILYTGTKCESCGVRFTPENMDKYSHHLDWHFRANRREKDSAKKAHSRKWYFDVEDWIQFEEIEDADERAQNYFDALAVAEEQGAKSPESPEVPTVPASEDEQENMCTVCKEQFEVFWDENDESWRLREAIEVDGKIYHPSCHEDIKKREQEFLKIETPTNSSILPGLDLLKSEEVIEPVIEPSTIDLSVVKKEPEEPESPGKDEGQNADLQASVKVEKVDEEPSIKQEPVDEDNSTATDGVQVESNDQTPVPEDNPIPDESAFDESFDTPTVEDSSTDPPTPLVDEKSEESPRPEPERVRITPQTGSGISINLCKSTVDSGLCDPNKNNGPTKESPAATAGLSEEVEESEEEPQLDLPPPDPRFAIQEPVMRGTELSGLCSIM